VTPEGSVSFDRAAGFYDATRAMPEETLLAVCDRLAGEVHGRGPSLEIGVGTGRIALPLSERGVELFGVDISHAMLEKLREKLGDPSGVRLAVADATAVPFVDDSFGAAYAVHVLHLISRWKDAVHELARVVRPGGLLLFDIGSADPSRAGGWMGPAREMEYRFIAESGIERRHPGITNIAELDDALSEEGAIGRDLDPINGSRRVALSTILALFEHGVYAFTWDMDEATRHRSAAAVRVWAEERYGDLDQPRDIEVVVAFRAYTLAG
jgi:SAM-dependent methyltransferase